LGREVGSKESRLDIECGETDSADSHGVPGSQFFRCSVGCNGDPADFPALSNAADASNFFDDAGEHMASLELTEVQLGRFTPRMDLSHIPPPRIPPQSDAARRPSPGRLRSGGESRRL